MKEKQIIAGKTAEEKLETAEETAKGYFRQGLNCAECVLRTYMDLYETGLPDEVLCMASGFGGGIGHTKNMCGAISGAIMALGIVKGRKDPFGPKEEMGQRIEQLQSQVYPTFAQLVADVKEEYGTLICAEMSQPFGEFDSKPRKRNCMQIIASCARLTVKYTEQ